jgi:predicted DNA-binding transcriptional regulator AlpA
MTDTNTTPKILRMKQIRGQTGVPPSTIYDHINKGLFTHPIKLGERISGWLESEVSEPAPKITPDTEKQSAWKIKAQNRANELSKINPKWTKGKVANVIAAEFKEQNTLNDLGKKSPDSQTIYKNIKIGAVVD